MKINPIKFLPAIVWFSISLWLLTLPGSKFPHEDWFDTLQVDKWVHISMFFGLCFLFIYPFKKSGIEQAAKMPWFLLITVSCIFFGVVIEFIQRDFVPNRSFDIWDIMADSLGSIMAFLWCYKKTVII